MGEQERQWTYLTYRSKCTETIKEKFEKISQSYTVEGHEQPTSASNQTGHQFSKGVAKAKILLLGKCVMHMNCTEKENLITTIVSIGVCWLCHDQSNVLGVFSRSQIMSSRRNPPRNVFIVQKSKSCSPQNRM